MKRMMMPAALLGTLALSGCRGSGDETLNYRLVKVTGTVTRNGKPLQGARVEFLPDPANKQATPGGDTTGPQGNYMVMYRNRTGVAPGKYKAVVVLPPPQEADIPPIFKDDPGQYEIALENMGKKGAAKKGAAVEKREWSKSVEVSDGGDVIDLDVKL